MHIRSMRLQDVAAVAAIESEVSAEPWPAELFKGEFGLSAKLRYWVVAENASIIVGFAGVMFGADEAQILNIGVQSKHFRQGCGSALVSSLLDECSSREVAIVHLEVRFDNWPAIELYRKFGFVVVGRRKDYYGSGRDAKLMSLILNQGAA